MAPTKILFFLIISFFVYGTSNATNHYVDKNANGNNNGSSWANAWQSFSAINWSIIQPGDIVYISGGTDSTIYYETMTVGADGTSDNQITIIAGKYSSSPTGHDGRVIIDGGSHSRLYAIHLDYRSYVTVKGFEVRDHQRGIAIRHDAVGCVVDSNRITNFTEQGGIRIDGSGSTCNPADWTSSDHIIQNNIIISPVDVPTQCDGIYIQRCQDVLIHNNFVHDRNASVVNSHTDGIQTHCTMNLTFTNNVVIVDSNAIGMPMVIRQESDGVGDADSVIFYNNLFYGGGLWFEGAPWLNCIDHQSDWGPSGVEPYTIMIHNTLISHGPFYAPVWKERHDEPNKHLMINNIVAQYGDGDAGIPSTYWHGTFRNSGGAWVVDSTQGGLYYNEYKGFDCMQSVTGNGNTGSCHSFSSWVNTYGGTGIEADPLFVDNIGYIEDEGTITGEIQSGSPAINAGVDIQAIVEGMGLPWTDINGTARDNTPDIGAYKYVPRGPDLTPPEVTGATLLDSITLKITFSEPLDPSTAQNPNNYSINNGITVVSALLTGSVVTLTTSPHANGTYTVTVSNVEDIAGNIVSPTANSADYDWTVILDVIPPEVTGATLLDSVTLKIMFSEVLEQSSAEDENNYSISNNIDIFNASLSGSEVTLQTSTHFPGSFIVTVVNVEDLAGNPIAQSNTAEYSLIPPDSLIFLTIEDVQGVIQEPGHTPLKTIDGLGALSGDPDSRWAAEPMPEELIFDLGSNRTVCKTKLSFYRWNYGRVYTYSILISNDNNNWVTIVSQATSALQEEWTIDEFPAVDARYVKVLFINNSESDWAGLWEGEIWGIIPSVADSVVVNLRSFLEGPYNDDAMLNDLSDQNLIPLTQPYYDTPWNYPGNESVGEIPNEVVDWVLLEIRSGIEVSSIIARRAAFLVTDGTIKDLNGESTVEFPEVSSGHYYVVVHHRNHLSIMTKDPIYLSESSGLYDFTTSLEKAYGNQPMKQLAGGKFGLYAADGNANGNINRADNKNVWRKQNGSMGYKSGDYDMNGGVNIKDKNAVYKPNKGRNTGVPMN